MRIQLGRTRVSAFIAALVGTAALTTGSLAQEKPGADG
jgi:hypothetical protein